MLFTSLFDTSRKSPFSGPISRVQCEAATNNQLVPGRTIAAAAAVAPADVNSCEFGSTKYFLLCGLGGIISCGMYCVCATMTFDLVPIRYSEIVLNREIPPNSQVPLTLCWLHWIWWSAACKSIKLNTRISFTDSNWPLRRMVLAVWLRDGLQPSLVIQLR